MDTRSASKLPRDLRRRLIKQAGGSESDVYGALLVGPDEDGFWYLVPPDDGDAWAWTQTPDNPESWRAAS